VNPDASERRPRPARSSTASTDRSEPAKSIERPDWTGEVDGVAHVVVGLERVMMERLSIRKETACASPT